MIVELVYLQDWFVVYENLVKCINYFGVKVVCILLIQVE